MGGCIGFGEFNRKYIYIILAVFCKFTGQLILGLSYSILKSLHPLSKELSSSSISYFTSNFLCSLILGYIGYKNSKKYQPNKLILIEGSLNESSSFSSIKSNDFQDKSDKINKILILVGFIFVFWEVSEQLFYSKGLVGLDFWMFEIIFLQIFMSKYLKHKNMLHQKLSLYIIVIPSFFLRIISNGLKSKNVNGPKSVYEYIIDKYDTIWIILFTILYLIMTGARAFGNTNIKYLMDILYVSPFKILIIYGSFGLIFSLLYIGFDLLFHKKYLGELNCFKKKTIKTLIFALLYGIINSLKILFDIFIIRDLSPFHLFAKYEIYYIMIQIILLCHHFIDNFKTFYFVEISSDIICFFGVLIYLELIELRCCNLSFYLKKNIIKRSTIESKTDVYKETEEGRESIKILNDLDIIDTSETYERKDNLY